MRKQHWYYAMAQYNDHLKNTILLEFDVKATSSSGLELLLAQRARVAPEQAAQNSARAGLGRFGFGRAGKGEKGCPGRTGICAFGPPAAAPAAKRYL